MKRVGVFLWLPCLAAAGVGAAMLFVTMPRLSVMAGGQSPFDMRWSGYSAEDAIALLAALGEPGRGYYLNTQQGLDTVFPLLFGLALGGAAIVLGRRAVRVALLLLISGGTVADYLENSSVAVMLRAGPDGVSAEMAARASALTQTKFALLACSVLAIAVLSLGRIGDRNGRTQ